MSRTSAKKLGVVSILTAAIGSSVACAPPEPASTFKDRAGTENNNDKPTGGLGGKDEASKDGAGAVPDNFKECATKTATAEAKPVYLVFMFDKSGSMVANGSPKWSSAKAASKAFFESQDSKGVSASLSFFPNAQNYSCDTNAYAIPSVFMTSLPSSTFGERLDNQQPTGATPTHAALSGAIQYAQGIAANEGKTGTVAIVLVTDGLPDSECNGNSISAVKQLAGSVSTSLKTYVIGVGNQLTSLKEIAAGGGTKDAFIVNANNPQQIQQDFLKAINTIKASALACDYEIPAPPTGEQLDRDMVNVIYKADGNPTTLPYNQACGDGATGWKYDDANSPKRILLCDASCDAVKAKPGQMDVLFGCATKGTDVK